MDADSNDGTATESLNGETKPDPAKLAQTAIIKQVGPVIRIYINHVEESTCIRIERVSECVHLAVHLLCGDFLHTADQVRSKGNNTWLINKYMLIIWNDLLTG